jgi:hypothetical protein
MSVEVHFQVQVPNSATFYVVTTEDQAGIVVINDNKVYWRPTEDILGGVSLTLELVKELEKSLKLDPRESLYDEYWETFGFVYVGPVDAE